MAHKNKNILIGVLLIIIALFFFFNIYSKHPSVVDDHAAEIAQYQADIEAQNQIIEDLNTKSDSVEKAIGVLVQQNDSLSTVKQQVKYEYVKIYTAISSGSNWQLDSLIRANW